MIAVIYLVGLEDGLAKDCQTLDKVWEFINLVGEHRINKIVITDFQRTNPLPTKQSKVIKTPPGQGGHL